MIHVREKESDQPWTVDIRRILGGYLKEGAFDRASIWMADNTSSIDNDFLQKKSDTQFMR